MISASAHEKGTSYDDRAYQTISGIAGHIFQGREQWLMWINRNAGGSRLADDELYQMLLRVFQRCYRELSRGHVTRWSSMGQELHSAVSQTQPISCAGD